MLIGKKLSDATVLIVGNSSRGIDLMNADLPICLEFPLRVCAWLDESTQEVWINFTDPLEIARIYGIDEQESLAKQLREGITNGIKNATSPDFIP